MEEPVPSAGSRGNRAMYERYALAHGRIKRAIAAGFPIEAVMICESIIVDRLASHLRKRYLAGFPIGKELIKIFNLPIDQFDDGRLGIGKVLPEFIHHFDDFGMTRYANLPQRIRIWTKTRNVAAHQFVKAHVVSRTYEHDHDVFLEKLNSCAHDGVALARLVSNWTRLKGALDVGL
jgi:hypothetical protein